MSAAMFRLPRTAMTALLVTALAGCATGYDYGEDYYGADEYYGGSTIGFGMGYYEPFGYNYGRWGPRFRVGPPPHGRHDHLSRPIPSIPDHPRHEHQRGGHPDGDRRR